MGNGYLAFDNGGRAFLRAMPCGPASWEFDVLGEKGRIRSVSNALDFELIKTVPGGPRGRGQMALLPFPWPARVQGMGLEVIDDMISSFENGHNPRCSGKDGRA